MTVKTILFSSNIGDTTKPVLDAITVSGAASFTGSVNGSGFVSAFQAQAPSVRYILLTDVKSITGLPLLTTTAATTLPGIARSAGTSLYLTGAATSGASSVTTNMMWELDVPDTYVAGANIPVLVNCVVPIAANVTAASTTLTVTAYTEINGVETALTVSAAQQIALTTASTLTFTLTGTSLIPGSHLMLQLVSLVTTTAGGASSVRINSVGFTA